MKEIKLPFKSIEKQLTILWDNLEGKDSKFADLTIRECFATIAMLEFLIEEDFDNALMIYNSLNFHPDMQLDYKIVDFISHIEDDIQNMIQEIMSKGLPGN